jgi:preprotein translocase subunit YajC
MWSDAFAQTAGGGAGSAAPAAPPANPMIGTLIQMGPFIFMLIIIYMLLIRPQQQTSRNLQKMRSALKKGDRVLTTGGIIGTIIGVEGEKAVLRVADDVKLEFATSAIVQLMPEAK